MQIDLIKEFLALAKFENYVIAAEELYISQPSLSKHIQLLERELGHPLFDRTTRKVQLTRFGKAYLPYAQRIVDTDIEARNILLLTQRDVQDSVHLGVIPAFISYHIEDHILAFQKKHPQYPITVTEGSNDILTQELMSGTCNLALIRTVTEPLPPNFVSIPYLVDQIALIIPAGHPFDDGRESVTWKDLETLPSVLTSTSSLQAKILDNLFKEQNIHLNISSRLSRSSSIVEMLQRGMASAALLYEHATEPYKKDKSDIKVIRIKPAIRSTVSLVYMRNRPVTAAMRTFLNIVFPEGIDGGFFHG